MLTDCFRPFPFVLSSEVATSSAVSIFTAWLLKARHISFFYVSLVLNVLGLSSVMPLE